MYNIKFKRFIINCIKNIVEGPTILERRKNELKKEREKEATEMPTSTIKSY